jgi:hypothetical protein
VLQIARNGLIKAFGISILRAIHFDNILESNPEEIRSICMITVEKLKEESEENRRDLWQTFTIIILKLKLQKGSSESDKTHLTLCLLLSCCLKVSCEKLDAL